MALRDTETLITQVGTPEETASLIEERINELDTGSGIHSITYIPVGNGSKVVGIIHHDAR